MSSIEQGIVRQRLPGVMSSRITTALFSGGSVTALFANDLLTNPETALPAIIISVGGTIGSFFYGMSRTKNNTKRYAQSLYGVEEPPVPGNTTVARAILGIPFEPQRVLVNSTPYVKPARKNIFSAVDPLSIKRVNKEVLLHQATVETDNYVLYTPQGVFLEQVTKPTALSTWDSAYNALIDQYGIPAEKIPDRSSSPLARENALDLILGRMSKEATSLNKFMKSL